MKRLEKGSFTIEAAVVVPLLLFAIGIIMVLLFYCHDKNILAGAVSEVVTVEVGRASNEDYTAIVEDKLFWFQDPRIEVTEKDGYMVATAKAQKFATSICVEARMFNTKPETFIRNVRKIEKITEGGEDEDILSDGFE